MHDASQIRHVCGLSFQVKNELLIESKWSLTNFNEDVCSILELVFVVLYGWRK